MIFYRPMNVYEIFYIFNKDRITQMYEKRGMRLYYKIEDAIEVINTQYLHSSNFGFSGFVTKFEITKKFLEENNINYTEQVDFIIINFKHIEELNFFLYKMFLTFNILKVFYGRNYVGLPSGHFLKYDLINQFLALKEMKNSMDFFCTIQHEYVLILTNFYYWEKFDFKNYGISEQEKSEILSEILGVFDTMHKNYLK